MAYKLNKQFLNRWFNGSKNIAMNENTSQEDLKFIFENQKEELVIKEEAKPTKKKKK